MPGKEPLFSAPEVGRAPTDHAYRDDPDNSNHYLRSSISQLNKLHYSLDIPFAVNINSHLETDHHHKDDGQLVKVQTLSQRIKGPTSGCISAVLGHARPNLGSSAPHIKPQYHSYRPEFLLRRRQALLKKNDGLKKNP